MLRPHLCIFLLSSFPYKNVGKHFTYVLEVYNVFCTFNIKITFLNISTAYEIVLLYPYITNINTDKNTMYKEKNVFSLDKTVKYLLC